MKIETESVGVSFIKKFEKKKLIPFSTVYDIVRQRHYKKLRKSLENSKPVIGRYPLNVQIQTVSACNGKCAFCPYQGSWHHKHPGKMSWEMYERIIQNLRNFKIKKFCPYLENEPLLDVGLFKKIRYAVENLNPEWVEISTNLSTLNEDKLQGIREIFSRTPHEIWISFHGVSKESYEEIMGLSFEKTLNNVIRLVELAQEEPLNIVIRGAGMPRIEEANLKNWFGKDEYLAFWKRKLSGFKKRPKISFFTYHDRAGSKQLRDKGMNFNFTFRDDLNEFYCVRFDRWLHFLYTGESILCCMDYNRETAFCENIKDKTIEGLFSSSRFIELIKKGIGMVESEDDFICKRCISPGG